MWCLNHVDDIASDLSVFHRVKKWWRMDAADYFRKAERLGAYAGVIQARATIENEQNESTPATGSHRPHSGQVKPRNVEATKTALRANASTADIFDFE